MKRNAFKAARRILVLTFMAVLLMALSCGASAQDFYGEGNVLIAVDMGPYQINEDAGYPEGTMGTLVWGEGAATGAGTRPAFAPRAYTPALGVVPAEEYEIENVYEVGQALLVPYLNPLSPDNSPYVVHVPAETFPEEVLARGEDKLLKAKTHIDPETGGTIFDVSVVSEQDGSRSVSLFAATDRHAHYETVSAEKESGSQAEPEKKRGLPKAPLKQTPVYDLSGELIWHNNLTDVLLLVAQDKDAVQPEIVLLGGDNVGEGGDQSRDETGYPMGAPFFSMRGVGAQICYVFGENAQGLFTYGSHDANETGKYEDVFFSGPVKGNGYWIYGISFAQMVYGSDRQNVTEAERGKVYSGKDLADPGGISAQAASQRFLSWVSSLEDHWPIIVMSHVPLHASRGDNCGAWIWTRALNDAAENHDIIFLWGHNHTLERGEKAKAAEQANYLLLPGETISVQSYDINPEGRIITEREIPAPEREPSERTEDEAQDSTEGQPEPESGLIVEEETLSFVYMNAGYITQGVGSLLTLTDYESDGVWDSLTVKRYMLDSAMADPISEMGRNHTVSLPLRDWNNPADAQESTLDNQH